MVVGAAALRYGWRTGMMIAGMLAILAGLFSAGDCATGRRSSGYLRWATGGMTSWRLPSSRRAGLTRKEILTKYVLLNPYIWLLSLCYVLVYVVRAAINDWGNLYMSETLGVDLVTANSAVTMFELGGFIGALVAGWGSDKLFNGNRGPMNLIFAAGILLSVGGLWLMPFASYVMQAACFFTTGFLCLAPDADWHGGGGVFPQRSGGRATGLSGCLPISGVAVRLAAGAGHGNLALERFSWSSRYCRRHFRAAAAAILNAQAPRTASEA